MYFGFLNMCGLFTNTTVNNAAVTDGSGFCLPYIIELNGILSQILKEFGINKIANYSIIKIPNSFSHVNDETPTMLHSGVVFASNVVSVKWCTLVRQFISQIIEHEMDVRN